MVTRRAERLRKKELMFQRFSTLLDLASKKPTDPPQEFADQIIKLGKGSHLRAWKEFVNPWLKELGKGRTQEEIWSGLPYEVKQLFKPD